MNVYMELLKDGAVAVLDVTELTVPKLRVMRHGVEAYQRKNPRGIVLTQRSPKVYAVSVLKAGEGVQHG